MPSIRFHFPLEQENKDRITEVVNYAVEGRITVRFPTEFLCEIDSEDPEFDSKWICTYSGLAYSILEGLGYRLE